jgi:hypothetical protein
MCPSQNIPLSPTVSRRADWQSGWPHWAAHGVLGPERHGWRLRPADPGRDVSYVKHAGDCKYSFLAKGAAFAGLAGGSLRLGFAAALGAGASCRTSESADAKMKLGNVSITYWVLVRWWQVEGRSVDSWSWWWGRLTFLGCHGVGYRRDGVRQRRHGVGDKASLEHRL